MTDAALTDSAHVVDDVAPNPKRGPGRPRKDPVDVSPAEPKRGPGRPPKVAPLREQLVRFYSTVGLGLMFVAPTTAGAVLQNAEACAGAVDAWAQTNPSVRRAIESLTAASAVGAVVAAHLPIALAAAAEFGKLPPALAAMAVDVPRGTSNARSDAPS